VILAGVRHGPGTALTAGRDHVFRKVPPCRSTARFGNGSAAHVLTTSMRTTGSMVDRGRSGRWSVQISWPTVVCRQTGCCTLVLHASSLTLKRQPRAHGSGGCRCTATLAAQITIRRAAWSIAGPRGRTWARLPLIQRQSTDRTPSWKAEGRHCCAIWDASDTSFLRMASVLVELSTWLRLTGAARSGNIWFEPLASRHVAAENWLITVPVVVRWG
jgi:hypothetical protein